MDCRDAAFGILSNMEFDHTQMQLFGKILLGYLFLHGDIWKLQMRGGKEMNSVLLMRFFSWPL